MVIVLVATRYTTLLRWIQETDYLNIASIDVIKRNGPKVYLYVDTNLTFREVCQAFKQAIKSHGGLMYVYELYSIYNGMIDYNAYMSEDTKSSMKYYQSQHKDITNEEIEKWKRT